jgi:ABC-type transport system involved in multi-copper enzyme maturation permease subunit
MMSSLPIFGAWYDHLPEFIRSEGWLVPLILVAIGTAAACLALVIFYYTVKLALPKLAAIARTTAIEAWAQPLFWVLVAFGAVLLLLSVFVPYNTLGDDTKVAKETGLTLIMVLGIFLAVWTASVSIADEVEGRTALTVLSKPVSRLQFVLGKFLGVVTPVYSLFVILGAVFLATISYKVSYDAKEMARQPPTVEQRQVEMVQVAPGLVLAFLETVVMASISVAISTRLMMLPNLLICSSVYVLGHLVPLVVNSAAGKVPLVRFIGQLIATVLPVLEHFNIQAAIATGRDVPLDYIGVATLYCLLYSTLAMLLALILFEDRDLA